MNKIADVIRSAFAYEANIKSYIVVIMWKTTLNQEQSWISMFATSTRRWSTPMMCEYNVGLLHGQGIYIGGNIYWLATIELHHKEQQMHIACFNVANLEFSHLALPDIQRGSSLKLIDANNSLAIVSKSPQDFMPLDFYDVWCKSTTSTNHSGWDKIVSAGPVLATYEFLFYMEDTCVFADPSIKFNYRDGKCEKCLFYIGSAMFAQFKEIHGTVPCKFRIKGCVNYVRSLTAF